MRDNASAVLDLIPRHTEPQGALQVVSVLANWQTLALCTEKMHFSHLAFT